MAEQTEAVATINNLIGTLKDGEKGFKEASEAVRDPHLQSLFLQYSQQRHRFASELQAQAESLGQSSAEKSSTAGAMHRAWINFKSILTSGSDRAILTEVERGEDSAMHEFEGAMNGGPSGQIHEIVSRQFTEIRSAHDRVKYLRGKENVILRRVRGCASRFVG